ncbi:MAG: hypothetical protein QOG58_2061, partial [Caballeronia sp.]|nr:hypothetical protein [Caballeronia sp.]
MTADSKLCIKKGRGPFSAAPSSHSVTLSNETQAMNSVFSVIFAFPANSLDTGQPSFAALASFSNVALSVPGTLAFRSRWQAVMENP